MVTEIYREQQLKNDKKVSCPTHVMVFFSVTLSGFALFKTLINSDVLALIRE